MTQDPYSPANSSGDGQSGWARPSTPPTYGPPPAYDPPPAPPGYGYGYTGIPASAAPPAAASTSTVVLLVLSGLLTLALSWTLLGLVYAVPAVLSIVALSKREDPSSARRLTRTGWIIFASICALVVLSIVAIIVALIAWDGGASASSSGGSV
ncbi:hypothetical protein SAMN06264364_104133 [Quadrisphaera granulorum]|uniref:DUF4190 domain-containing protein n=1 Tax=Quadrisphaera granulorum TaxID=317664 RepID=A0A316AE17_9ACTN|nr:hypothetical protein [Quadrisphaera granulorum]PWJ55210.1 hypothetical protein BXY45_104133 [Quadrisphaera granulorum]SZE95719.1 hypothetical protein SAMN06264364_104133 [Quadrisphaera granulorum]